MQGPPSIGGYDQEMTDPNATRVQNLRSPNEPQSIKFYQDGPQEGHTGSQVEQYSGNYGRKFGLGEDDQSHTLRNRGSSSSPYRDVEMKPAYYEQPEPISSARSRAGSGPDQKPKKVTYGEVKVSKKRTLHINDYKKFKKIKNIEGRYAFGKTLGQGAFGVVRLCMHKDSGKTFAIKIMQKAAIEK
jgi:hypothetical protein